MVPRHHVDFYAARQKATQLVELEAYVDTEHPHGAAIRPSQARLLPGGEQSRLFDRDCDMTSEGDSTEWADTRWTILTIGHHVDPVRIQPLNILESIPPGSAGVLERMFRRSRPG